MLGHQTGLLRAGVVAGGLVSVLLLSAAAPFGGAVCGGGALAQPCELRAACSRVDAHARERIMGGMGGLCVRGVCRVCGPFVWGFVGTFARGFATSPWGFAGGFGDGRGIAQRACAARRALAVRCSGVRRSARRAFMSRAQPAPRLRRQSFGCGWSMDASPAAFFADFRAQLLRLRRGGAVTQVQDRARQVCAQN